jgi:flagellar motor switch protein FliG
MIQEEIEYMGPKRLSEVEAAQLRIIEVIRSLEEANEIIIPGRGGGSGDTVV